MFNVGDYVLFGIFGAPLWGTIVSGPDSLGFYGISVYDNPEAVRFINPDMNATLRRDWEREDAEREGYDGPS